MNNKKNDLASLIDSNDEIFKSKLDTELPFDKLLKANYLHYLTPPQFPNVFPIFPSNSDQSNNQSAGGLFVGRDNTESVGLLGGSYPTSLSPITLGNTAYSDCVPTGLSMMSYYPTYPQLPVPTGMVGVGLGFSSQSTNRGADDYLIGTLLPKPSQEEKMRQIIREEVSEEIISLKKALYELQKRYELMISETYLKKSELEQFQPHCDSNKFVKNGEIWEVVYQGKHIMLNNTKGLKYIAYLISKKEKLISIDELESLFNKKAVDTIDHFGEDLSIEGFSSQEINDNTAIRNYQKRIIQLEKNIEIANETGNQSDLATYNDELNTILDEYKKKTGKSGRSRGFNTPYENCRKRVSKAVRGAINKINEQCPLLAQHLTKEIMQNNGFYIYSPSERLEWETVI